MNGRVPSGGSPVFISGGTYLGVEMRKRRTDGRFVAGPGVGAERVSVEMAEGEAKGGKKRPNPPRGTGCRTYTRCRVAEALPDIVETFVERAKAGSVAHARALASLGGLDKGDVVEKTDRRRGKSLGRRLGEELDRAKERAAARVRKAEEREAKEKEAREAAQKEAEAGGEAPTEGVEAVAG